MRAILPVLHADHALALRLEEADAALLIDYAHALEKLFPELRVRQRVIAGAAIVCSENDPYHNRVTALGLLRSPSDTELEVIEEVFASLGASPQIDLAPFVDEALLQGLAERGYRVGSYLTILGRPILEEERLTSSTRVEVSMVGADQIDLWIGTAIRGFEVPSSDVAWHQRMFRAASARPGTFRFLARLNGDIVGCGSVSIRDGIALMHATAVLAKFRRKGAHRALLNARLSFAATAGCDIAVVHTRPGDLSQRSVERLGFRVLYTRTVMTNHPPFVDAARSSEPLR